MKVINLAFASDLSQYLENIQNKTNIIFPYRDGLKDSIISNYTVTFFDQQFYQLTNKTLIEISLILMRTKGLNFEKAANIVEIFVNETEFHNHLLNIYGTKITQKIENSNNLLKYKNELKLYVQKIASHNKGTPLIIGFDRQHILIRELMQQKLENCEIIFIDYKNHNTSHSDLKIKGRHVLLQSPEIWHTNKQNFINGIKIIDCDSRLQEVSEIKSLNKDSYIISNDPVTLQNLEISIEDFSYKKSSKLDCIIILLGRLLDDDISITLLKSHYITQNITLSDLIQHKNCLFQGLKKGSELIKAHIELFRRATDISLSEIAKNFIDDLSKFISDFNFTNLIEYRNLFLLLSQNIKYKQQGRITAIETSYIKFTTGTNIIILTSNWKNENSFYQLLHIPNILIVHRKSTEQPSWLLKLRILLSNKHITKYTKKSLSNLNYLNISNSVANPPFYSRPNVLSATMIETLLCDPYAFYIRYILKITPKFDNEVVLFGNFVHKVLEQYTKNKACDYDLLLYYGNQEIKKYSDIAQSKSIWWPKFKKIAQHFVKEDKKRITSITKIDGEMKLEFKISDYTITAKCDRLEHLNNGSISIIDYKTGSLPTIKDIKSRLSPQLLIQGIAANHKFKKDISELLYWQLKTKELKKMQIKNCQDEMRSMKIKLQELLQNFATMTFTSNAYYQNYKHFSRQEKIF